MIFHVGTTRTNTQMALLLYPETRFGFLISDTDVVPRKRNTRTHLFNNLMRIIAKQKQFQ